VLFVQGGGAGTHDEWDSRLGGTILISVLAAEPPVWAPSAILLIAAPFVGQDAG
jgi:hypothetical protein